MYISLNFWLVIGVEFPLALYLKFSKSRVGVSEVPANIIISFTLISMIISMYAFSLNHVSILYSRSKLGLAEDYLFFLASSLDKLYFEDESRIFNFASSLLVFKLDGFSSLLLNDHFIGSWSGFKIIFHTNFKGYSESYPIIVHGVNDTFSVNGSSFYIILSNMEIIVGFNIKLTLMDNKIFARVYSLNSRRNIILNGDFIIRVSSVHRSIHKLNIPGGLLRFSVVHNDLQDEFKIKLPYKEVFVLFEIIELEVEEL